jgi:ceramide glucosyltransferase
MSEWIACGLFLAAAVGLALLAGQAVSLRRHLAAEPAKPRAEPGISIMKPLCGLDDGLAESLASFAALGYASYEVLLGVRSRRDAAWPVAREAARRWPERFRVVIQRGEPGLNPKVNQLITLARAARHGILVVSDSNVRVGREYLREIAGALEDGAVGLVTHPVVGLGEERLGSLFDNLHLAGWVAPGMVAAKRIAGRDFVVGKSMAFRRADLEALGGFEAVKDVLAEDYVLGLMVGNVLGKRVALASSPVQNFSAHKSVAEFASRYRRWAVLQRQSVGRIAYGGLVLSNPVLLSAAALAALPTPGALAGFAGICAVKIVLDASTARALRPGGFRAAQLWAVPLKDLVFGGAWACGLLRSDVAWRGNRIRVGRGTRIVSTPTSEALGASAATREGAVAA